MKKNILDELTKVISIVIDTYNIYLNDDLKGFNIDNIIPCNIHHIYSFKSHYNCNLYGYIYEGQFFVFKKQLKNCNDVYKYDVFVGEIDSKLLIVEKFGPHYVIYYNNERFKIAQSKLNIYSLRRKCRISHTYATMQYLQEFLDYINASLFINVL